MIVTLIELKSIEIVRCDKHKECAKYVSSAGICSRNRFDYTLLLKTFNQIYVNIYIKVIVALAEQKSVKIISRRILRVRVSQIYQSCRNF